VTIFLRNVSTGHLAQHGAPGFAVYQQGKLVTIASVTVAAGRVTRLDLIRAAAKLPHGAGQLFGQPRTGRSSGGSAASDVGG
jgi:hypothetical protein